MFWCVHWKRALGACSGCKQLVRQKKAFFLQESLLKFYSDSSVVEFLITLKKIKTITSKILSAWMELTTIMTKTTDNDEDNDDDEDNNDGDTEDALWDKTRSF